MGFGTSRRPAATPLQAARQEIEWKQSQTLAELKRLARSERLTIASDASLKTMLSRWENGHDEPDSLYQRLLCRLYGLPPSELGFSRASAALDVPRIAPTLSPAMTEYFRNIFREHLRADNLMGPHQLVAVVRSQVDLLDQILGGAYGDLRHDLLLLGCQYNEFTGWLYQDAGDVENAARYTDRAMDYALELDNVRFEAYVLMRKSNIAVDSKNPGRALGLAEAAMRDQLEVPHRTRALILNQRARAYAALGNRSECDRAVDAAREAISHTAESVDELAPYCTPSYVEMEAASCWRQLDDFEGAIAVYSRSLVSWPAEYRRDHGLCLARLADAHAGAENIAAACSIGNEAIDVVQTATSSRALRALQQLRVRLAPWRRDAEVSALNSRLRDLLQPMP